MLLSLYFCICTVIFAKQRDFDVVVNIFWIEKSENSHCLTTQWVNVTKTTNTIYKLVTYNVIFDKIFRSTDEIAYYIGPYRQGYPCEALLSPKIWKKMKDFLHCYPGISVSLLFWKLEKPCSLVECLFINGIAAINLNS